ncbi:helix-turn-helix domain-containing protein [uncultured Sphingorhabdus sp.]|uniref:helix-turn-helix domain-containing protein n=1 Tax=uncultured Sphingorhabdus sp. TaxID=1686106 RepID=UPI0026263601|nr:helix-turn-helix domain-containing protein [uncultured Sphingorhabdus sp.]
MFIRRPSDIGLLVKAARKARSMSQDDLARRLGVSRLWINEFEGGKPTARLDLVLRALAELDITLTAQTDGPIDGGDLVETPTDTIDIDDIADTGLSTPKALREPRTPAVTKRGRR